MLRARYTTFGKAIVTVAQKGDLSIRMWSTVYERASLSLFLSSHAGHSLQQSHFALCGACL